ncbi:hypothetical protein [Pelagovum pacificum]|uniref:DUF4157 domain-containing protein n=1 Tax=Pelagovum pacificum TaxID=2588711 RepID=A0A5C5GCP2_9RHOB|nr:hypothetical protein [Pelagovum pacificum]QQA44380.1 hypothetical protein I8N54_07360 [Pelagovum pacificum]TNY32503.1 hypothetical protein FHY64_04220 [Pelagovum pacificum]
MRLLILCLLFLSACTRPLTPAEQAFAAQIVGEETAYGRVRLTEAGPVGAFAFTYPTRPRTTCRERILPPNDGPTYEARTAGITLFDHVITNPDWYLADYLQDWPERMNLVAAMFFAHELTHVWQWQNREQTGYTLYGVASEHAMVDDPYLFDSDALPRFADYGYEQQGALVEEYVCCQALAPEASRTQRLRALLSQEMPIGEWRAPQSVLLPYDEVELAGICD